ncbi:MAG: hypothetical protein IPM85_01190 [Chitinophagaceae bacterium]|nr:hypothetical protein [Chitinophagaceae bacterium]
MEKEQGSAVRSGWWILKPVYAIALIATVIVVNLAVVLIKTDTQNTLTNDSDRFQTIAADYNLADNGSFYEINQENK